MPRNFSFGIFDSLLFYPAHVELPLSLLSPPPGGPSNPTGSASSPPTAAAPVSTLNKEKKKKHHLTTSTDPLFAELRDLNFSSVGKKLNRVAHRLDEDYKVLVRAFDIMCRYLIGVGRLDSKRKQCHSYVISWAN